MHAEAVGEILWSFFRKLMDQRVDFGVGTGQADAGFELHDGKNIAIARGQQRHGNVKVGFPRVVFGHDANDAVGLVVDFQSPSENIPVAVVMAHPEVVAEHDHRLLMGSFGVRRLDVAAEQGGNPQETTDILGDIGEGDIFRNIAGR